MVFGPANITINLPKCKTDQLREGSSVVVARSGTPTCPVAMLQQYCTRAALDRASQNFMFQGIVRTKNSEQLKTSGHISYTRVRELILQRLAKLGYDAAKFSIRSFRAGRATADANAGVPDRLFKCHGRWCSASAKDGYVKDSVESRQCLSKPKAITELAFFVTLYVFVLKTKACSTRRTPM